MQPTEESLFNSLKEYCRLWRDDYANKAWELQQRMFKEERGKGKG